MIRKDKWSRLGWGLIQPEKWNDVRVRDAAESGSFSFEVFEFFSILRDRFWQESQSQWFITARIGCAVKLPKRCECDVFFDLILVQEGLA